MSFQNTVENLPGEKGQGNNALMQQTIRSGSNQVVHEIIVPQPITFPVQSTATYLTYMQLNYAFAQITWLVPTAAYTFQTHEFHDIERYDSIWSTTAAAVQCLSFTACQWIRDFYQHLSASQQYTILRMTNNVAYADSSLSIHSQLNEDAVNWRGFINPLYLEGVINVQHEYKRLVCYQEIEASRQHCLLSEVRMARQFSIVFEVNMNNSQQEYQNHKIDFVKPNYIKGQKSCRALHKKRRFQPYPRRVPSKYIKKKKTKSEINLRK